MWTYRDRKLAGGKRHTTNHIRDKKGKCAQHGSAPIARESDEITISSNPEKKNILCSDVSHATRIDFGKSQLGGSSRQARQGSERPDWRSNIVATRNSQLSNSH